MGVIYYRRYGSSEKRLFLVKKTTRFPCDRISEYKICNFTELKFLFLSVSALIYGDTIWLPGVSPTSCTIIEKFCYRFLFAFNRLKFYDDGMAGFIENTYTWFHTNKFFPLARGNATWNHVDRSFVFKDAQEIEVNELAKIEHGLDPALLKKNMTYSVFIEAAATDVQGLFDSYCNSLSFCEIGMYFAHVDKQTVSRQYKQLAKTVGTASHFHLFSSDKYLILEPYIMLILDTCKSIEVFSGCTSTLLIFILYAFKTNQLHKIRIHVKPSYVNVSAQKRDQYINFYKYLQNYCSNFIINYS